jgi:hypothetical protein
MDPHGAEAVDHITAYLMDRFEQFGRETVWPMAAESGSRGRVHGNAYARNITRMFGYPG